MARETSVDSEDSATEPASHPGLHRGSNMSAHALLNLLNELAKR